MILHDVRELGNDNPKTVSLDLAPFAQEAWSSTRNIFRGSPEPGSRKRSVYPLIRAMVVTGIDNSGK